jgi:predicted DNA-binding transcriptional regulator AlpA
MATTIHQLPEAGFLRLHQIIGDKKANPPILPIIPIGKTTFLQGVKSGKYPKPVKLSQRTVAWQVQDIRALIEKMNGGAV